MTEIRTISLPIHGLEGMAEQARIEGYRHIDRLIADWANGTNRFEGPGELLLGAFDGDRLIGIGGLNRDPYATDQQVGRVRRFYVSPEHRRTGTGRLILLAIVEKARESFTCLRLRTPDQAASRFYESVGFSPVQGDGVSHILDLGGGAAFC